MKSAYGWGFNNGWLIGGAAVIGILCLGAIISSLSKKETSKQSKTEVPKQTTQPITVPSGIPESYRVAKELFDKMESARYCSETHDTLFNLKHVSNVSLSVDANVTEFVSEAEIKTKFGLVLHKYGIPMNPKSPSSLSLVVRGLRSGSKNELLTYAIDCELSEFQYVFRQGECRKAHVSVWRGGYFGNQLRDGDALLKGVEKLAELFANDYLTANPKGR